MSDLLTDGTCGSFVANFTCAKIIKIQCVFTKLCKNERVQFHAQQSVKTDWQQKIPESKNLDIKHSIHDYRYGHRLDIRQNT